MRVGPFRMVTSNLLLAKPSRDAEFYSACIFCLTACKRAITITKNLVLVIGFPAEAVAV